MKKKKDFPSQVLPGIIFGKRKDHSSRISSTFSRAREKKIVLHQFNLEHLSLRDKISATKFDRSIVKKTDSRSIWKGSAHSAFRSRTSW